MKKPAQKQTAVCYYRVSDREQKNGLSLDSQCKFVQQFCSRNNITILKEFSEVTTGKKFDRKELNALKEFCKKQKPTYMLVWRWDRLGRNAIEMLSIVRDFKGTGVEINATEQWKDGDSADDKFMLQLQAILAERESNITSERTKKNMRYGMEMGYWLNKLPLGYRRSNVLNERGKRSIEICPVGAPIVKEIFDLFLNGMDKMAIRTHIMNKHGKSLRGINYNFVKMAIRRILSNPFYTGRLIIKDDKGEVEKLVDAKHPAIIPMDLFDAVQQRLERLEGKHGKSEHQEKEEYPLKGSLFCIHCLLPLRAYKVKKKLKTGAIQEIHYYDCKDNHFRINANVAHRIVEEALSEMSFSEEDKVETLKEIQKEISKIISAIRSSQLKLKTEISDLKIKLEKLDNLLLNGLSVGNYERMSNELRHELKVKESELSNAISHTDLQEKIFNSAADMMVDLGEDYKYADGFIKKKIIKALFPVGFFIDKVHETVLTLFLNSFVDATHSKSIKYKRLRLIKSEEVSFCSP